MVLGWGTGNKFEGTWCDGQSGALLGADGYKDLGGGRLGFLGGRKWWLCKKTQSQIEKDLKEYYREDGNAKFKPKFNKVKPRPPTLEKLIEYKN